MKASLKSTLDKAMEEWLEDNDNHDDRPAGIACEGLADAMADAAAAVYDVSHRASMEGAEDPETCGVEHPKVK